MDQIYKSDEILKNINNSNYHTPEIGEHMRIIRGLYVVGVHRPPHYIDRTLMVTDQSSTKATVYSYTEEYVQLKPSDCVVGFNDVHANALELVQYTTRTEQLKPGEYVVGFKDVHANALNLTLYETLNKQVKPGEFVVGFTNVTIDEPLSVEIVEPIPVISKEIPPGQPTLQITNIGGAKATITSEGE